MNYMSCYGFNDQNEKPLDNITQDGGFCKIFRTIGCIGDSLSSGEFEYLDEDGKAGGIDLYDYSWGQYMARECGCKVYNFSRGGMTAREYMKTFAEEKGFWDDDKVCQAYIIALGVNDILNEKQELGSVNDIDLNDYHNNKDTFAGWYGAIIQRLKEKQPKARFFLVSMLRDQNGPASPEHTKLLYDIAKLFDFTYVLDLEQYAPVYDLEFKKYFFLATHLNAAGYMFTAKIIESYIDYIIRHNMDDFCQIGFVGTEHHNVNYKW